MGIDSCHRNNRVKNLGTSLRQLFEIKPGDEADCKCNSSLETVRQAPACGNHRRRGGVVIPFKSSMRRAVALACAGFREFARLGAVDHYYCLRCYSNTKKPNY
jgi:hypothetical protein